MSRSIWATALGVSVFALAATLSASPGEPAQPASIHAEQASYQVPIVHHIVPVQTPALRHPHANAVRLRGHSAARALTQPHVVLLAPGSGFQQAAGSGPVRALQRRLAGLGFAPGPIDGRYGPLTTDAVERFQNASGLIVDGIVGARTLAALSARPSSGLAPGAGYQQAAGSGRVRVRVLQRRLAGLGFAPGPIDGRYGPLTTDAVERFQSARRLTVNGIVGAQTLRVLSTARRRPIPISDHASHHPARPSHTAVPTRSAPVQRPPETPVTRVLPSLMLPLLLVLAAVLVLVTMGLGMMLLSYGRTRARTRSTPALLQDNHTPDAASEIVGVHDAVAGPGGGWR
jgi:peptidoglycan hydrolase-like protein with peptidoglycan-binding domain